MHIKDARAAVISARKLVNEALQKLADLELALNQANRYEKPLKGTQDNPDKQQVANPAPRKGS